MGSCSWVQNFPHSEGGVSFQHSANNFEVLYICWHLGGKLYSYCKLSFKSILFNALAHLKCHHICGHYNLCFYFSHPNTYLVYALSCIANINDTRDYFFHMICCMVYMATCSFSVQIESMIDLYTEGVSIQCPCPFEIICLPKTLWNSYQICANAASWCSERESISIPSQVI